MIKTLKEIYESFEAGGVLAPAGECDYCDNVRNHKETFFPPHRKYAFCRSYSGGRHHCTCDTCF